MGKEFSLVERRKRRETRGKGGETQDTSKGSRVSLKDAYCAQQPATKETIAVKVLSESPHDHLQTTSEWYALLMSLSHRNSRDSRIIVHLKAPNQPSYSTRCN